MEFRLRYFVSIQAQIILFVLSATIFGYLFYKPILTFDPVGKESFVLPVTPEVIKKWGKEPVRVKTGFMLHQFINFDSIKNDFLVTAIIWFEFDPKKVSLDTISKFTFTKGDVVTKTDPIIIKKSDTVTFVKYNVRIQFNTIMNYTYFPLNDHMIYLNFTNPTVNADDVVFDVAPADFVVPSYISASGWEFVQHSVRSGYTEYSISQENKTSREPKIVFGIGVRKTDIRQLILMILPILLLFYFCIFMLSIHDLSLNLGNLMMLVTAYMAYNVVIQSLSPAVGYMMLIDYLVLLFLCAMFVIFVVLMLGNVSEDRLSRESFMDIKGGTVLVVYIVVLVAVFYLTHYMA